MKNLVRQLLINNSAQGSMPHVSGLKPDDIILASYPKSGNTWLRMIVGHLLYPNREIKSLAELNWIVPDIYWGIPRWVRYSSPRAIKTHQPFSFRHEGVDQSLYQRNIYIVRHPLDVALSFFDFQLKLWPNPETSFDVFARKFSQGGLPGNSSWQEHVLSWKSAEYERSVLFLKYEDLVMSPVENIINVGRYLGVDVNEQICGKIAEKTSRSSMQEKERVGNVVEKSYNFISDATGHRLTRSDVSVKAKATIEKYSKIAMELLDYEMLP